MRNISAGQNLSKSFVRKGKKQLTLSQWEIHVENIKVGKFLRSCYFFQDIGKL